MPPDHVGDVNAEIGAIEGDCFSRLAVVEHNIKTAGKSDKKFLKLTVGMATANLATGDVIDPVCSLNDKRHMTSGFNEAQISAVVVDFGERDHSAIIQTVHLCIPYCRFGYYLS